jgi:hypothetical protein
VQFVLHRLHAIDLCKWLDFFILFSSEISCTAGQNELLCKKNPSGDVAVQLPLVQLGCEISLACLSYGVIAL